MAQVAGGGQRHRVARRDVCADGDADGDACVARLRCRERWEQRELFAVARPSSLDSTRAKDGKPTIDSRCGTGVEVDAGGLKRGSLEPGEGRTELLIRPTVYPAADRPQERMEGERDHAVVRARRFVIAVEQLDVDVLIKRARDAVIGAGDDTPSPPGSGGIDEGGIVGRIRSGRTELLIRPTVYPAADRPQERMEGERDHAVVRARRFVIAVEQLDVDVLIKRARDAVIGAGDDTPSPPGSGGIDEGGIVGRI